MPAGARPRRLSASEAAEAMVRQQDWEQANRWPDEPAPGPEREERRMSEAKAGVPEDEAEEGFRRRDWRNRMRESRAMMEELPRGEEEMLRRGGKKTYKRGKVVWVFPEGGMRR